MAADTPPWQLLVVVIVAGVVLPGVTRNLLSGDDLQSQALFHLLGHGINVGMLVWLVGYGSMVFIVWYGWIRPLDIGER